MVVRPDQYLHPGTLVVSEEPLTVKTLLSTCVALCLYDPDAGVGGMNHYLLPASTGEVDDSLRYGRRACWELYDRMLARGALPQRMLAKVFGGVRRDGSRAKDLGLANVTCARDFLKQVNVKIVAQCVQQAKPMVVLFQTATGEAWVRDVG